MIRKQKLIAIVVFLPALLFLFSANAECAKKAPKGWLGVHIQELTPSLKESLKLGDRKGLLVPEVLEDSPAEKAGIEDGDVILTWDGQPVEMTEDFSNLVQKTVPGTEVKVQLFREGKEQEVKVMVGKVKKSPRIQIGDNKMMIFQSNRPRLGVEAHELNADLAPYFKAKAEQGVLVLKVVEESAAAKAGLKAGDVILKVDEEATNSPADLVEALSDYEDGDEISLEYARAGKTSVVKIELETVENESENIMEFEDQEIFLKKPGIHKEIIIKDTEPNLKKKIEWHQKSGDVI